MGFQDIYANHWSDHAFLRESFDRVDSIDILLPFLSDDLRGISVVVHDPRVYWVVSYD